MSKRYFLLFDYDGVITYKVDFAGRVSRKYHLPEAALQQFFRQYLQGCLVGEQDLVEALAESMERIGWQGMPEDLFKALYHETLKYNDAVLDFIGSDMLKSQQCFLATNQDKRRLVDIRSDQRLIGHFEGIFCSCEMGISKPDLGFFDRVFEALINRFGKVAKEQVFFVDDLLENIESADAYGFKVHLFEDVEYLKNHLKRILSGEQVFPVLRTHRTTLGEMRLLHARGYSEILSDSETYRFLSEHGPVDRETAKKKIIRNVQSFYDGRSIYWSIINDENKFIGFVAIHNWDKEEVPLSFGIHPAYRRQGFAREAVLVVLRWAGQRRRRVTMSTHLDNGPSFRFLSSLNLHYEGKADTKFGQRHVFTYLGKA